MSISPQITAQATLLNEAMRPFIDELLGSQDGSVPGLIAECTTLDEVKHITNVFSSLARRLDNPRPFGSQSKGLAQVAFGRGKAIVDGLVPTETVAVEALSVEQLQAALAAKMGAVEVAGGDDGEPF